MLDLLTKITKTYESTHNGEIINEDRLNVWFKILPLLFDVDKKVQNATIIAFDAMVPYFFTCDIQNHPNWPTTKTEFIQT